MPRRIWIVAVLAAITSIGVALAPAAAADPGVTNGRIAFGTRANGGFNIDTVMPDGSGLKSVTNAAGFNLCAEYTPDGRDIVYCSNVSGAFELWTVKQNGAKPTQLTHFGGFVVFPDVSPDGSKIAFTGFVADEANDQVFVVDAATGADVTQLTSCSADHPGCFNSFPTWSPDGTKIAFSHGDGFDAEFNPDNEQIWVMNSDGSNAHPITTGPAPKDQVPDWSPDGSKISFAAGFFGSGGIWTINADGTDARQLTGCGASDPSPCPAGDDFGTAWSPDGKQIVFLRDLTSLGIADRQVTVMNADGTGAHSISSPGLHAVPAWQARGVSSGG